MDASRAGAWGRAVGRLGGCLWVVFAAWGFIALAGAAGASIPVPSALLLPMVVVPLTIAAVVFVAGNRVFVLLLSAAGGIAYAGLAAWNHVRP